MSPLRLHDLRCKIFCTLCGAAVSSGYQSSRQAWTDAVGGLVAQSSPCSVTDGIPLVFSRLPGLLNILPQPLLQHEERASACQHPFYTELCHQDIQIQLRTTGGSWGPYQLGPRMPHGLASEYHKGTCQCPE